MAEAPKITIDGKEYVAPRPKAKMFRKIIKFNKNFANANLAENEEAYDEVLGLVAETFDNPAVTPQAVEDNTYLDEVFTLLDAVGKWITKSVGNKSKTPNSPKTDQ